MPVREGRSDLKQLVTCSNITKNNTPAARGQLKGEPRLYDRNMCESKGCLKNDAK